MRTYSSTCRLSATLSALFVAGSAAGILAAHAGGAVVAWGGIQEAPLGNFIFVRGGSSQAVGIRDDGRLALWGGLGDAFAIPPLPGSIANDVFISADIAKSHLLALTWDGRVFGWGSNAFGQLTAPVNVRFTAVAAGGRHSLGIALDGTLRGWGDPIPINVPAGKYIAVSARATYSTAIRQDGTLIGWGVAPAVFDSWTSDGAGHYYVAGERFTSISAGVDHALALTIDNRVVGWGVNTDGQIDSPSKVRFKAVAAGEGYSLGIAVNGRVVAWGNNSLGQVDQAPAGKVDDVAAAAHNAFAILK